MDNLYSRPNRQLIEIVDRLNAKKVSLRILCMGSIHRPRPARLMLQVIGATGEFEREVMLERQREGIAKAQEIADRLGIGVASVYRVLADARASA